MGRKPRQSKFEEAPEPEFIVIDELSRVFAGCRRGYPYFSENIDEAKPLRGQSKFEFLQKHSHINLEQIFL